MNRDEIHLASFPFGGSAAVKLRPVLLLTGPVGSVPEVLAVTTSSPAATRGGNSGDGLRNSHATTVCCLN